MAMAMAIPRRYAALAILLALTLVVFLGHSTHSRFKSSSSFMGGTGDLAEAPYTAAIVYLLSVMPGPRPAHKIFDSLSLMQKHIPWKHQWPVLLLHAGAYESAETQAEFVGRLRETAMQGHGLSAEMAEALVGRLEFVETHHELPEGIPASGADDSPIWSGEWPGASPPVILLPCAAY